MAEQTSVKPTLGLTGVTMNAMALIAPGAFLWITFQLQAAATAPDGSSVASDMWAGIGLALIIAFLTAISYGQLARLYPEAGFGSAYYFAEKAFLDRENKEHHRWARLADAAETGSTLEVIVVLRGRVRRGSRPGRWRMRLSGGGVATFTADAAVAVTPVARRGR